MPGCRVNAYSPAGRLPFAVTTLETSSVCIRVADPPSVTLAPSAMVPTVVASLLMSAEVKVGTTKSYVILPIVTLSTHATVPLEVA